MVSKRETASGDQMSGMGAVVGGPTGCGDRRLFRELRKAHWSG